MNSTIVYLPPRITVGISPVQGSTLPAEHAVEVSISTQQRCLDVPRGM